MTVRAVLAKNKIDSKGLCPVKICVTIKGRRSYQATGIRIKESDWSDGHVKKTVHGAKNYNQIIKDKIYLAEQKILSGKASAKSVFTEKAEISIYDYAKRLIKETGKGKYSPGYTTRFKFDMDRMKMFAPKLTFEDINHSFLRKYENYLRHIKVDEENSLAPNTVHRIWKRLRSVFYSARREGLTDNNPFATYPNPKYSQTIRTYLISDEVDLIEQALSKPLSENQRVTANYFLLGCYSGLRHSDWSRHKGFIQGDRILLRTKKTGEIVSLPMHSRLKAVIERLKDLPDIYSEAQTNTILKSVATVAGITKHLTTHVARHSFAVRCAELDIAPAVTAELMGISVRTVMIYYRITNRKIDAEVLKWDNEKAPG